MIHTFTRNVVACLLLVCGMAAPAMSSPLKAHILQYRLHRWYFDAGKEANIFSGCPFVLLYRGDTLLTGHIDQSAPGISYSFPEESNYDFVLNFLYLTSLEAVIEAADVDSVSPIVLGAENIEPVEMLFRTLDEIPSDRALLHKTAVGNEIVIKANPPVIDMPTSFQLGNLDGFFSYSSHASELPEAQVSNAPAPFIVVLVPNLKREVNRNGMLTTSLYYRFNEKRLAIIFDGDLVTPQHCFLSTSAPCPRPYAFNPRQGRGLLEQSPVRPRLLRIGVMSSSLRKTAWYLIDILARDRVEAELTGTFGDADVSLAFVPFDSTSPLRTLQYIRRTFLDFTPESPSAQEALQKFDVLLEEALFISEDTLRLELYRKAQNILVHDLGFFPLFRPHLFFHASEKLKNIAFDERGFFSPERLVKLRLPTAVSGGEKK